MFDNDDDDSHWIASKLPCDACGSSDARHVNSKGWSHCFSCGENKRDREFFADAPAQNPKRKTINTELVGDLDFSGLRARGIDGDTCRKWGYGTGRWKGKTVHVAQQYAQGRVVAQKLRTKDKEFIWLGDRKPVEPLYGMHLWPSKGKMVVITEGEIDALTVSMLQQNKWPVVSLTDGANSAKKAIGKACEWLAGYEKIILMFDEDEPGRKAVEQAASVLPPGKVYIAKLPYKDANECLQKGEGAAVIKAIFDAHPWRPEAVLSGQELWNQLKNYKGPVGVEPPWKLLQKFIHVLPLPSVVAILAGTGSGKTTFCRAIEHDLIKRGENVGILHLEEPPLDTVLGLVGYDMGRVLAEDSKVDEAVMKQHFDATAGREGVFFYDNFGSMDPEVVFQKIRYMATVGGCRYIFLDHLSILLSGLDGENGTAVIDRVMTRLVSLAKELNICIILVSHLTKAKDGKPFEEGAQISLQNARGSHGIAQLSYIVLALERDQQAKDPKLRDLIRVRVLKNRPFRVTGVACKLLYDQKTGRLFDYPADYMEDPEDEFSKPEPEEEPKEEKTPAEPW